jgi:hypothetical protein
MGLSLAVLLAGSSPGVTPVDTVTSSLVGYVLSYGIVGVCALTFAWLLLKGWRLISPAQLAAALAGARAEGRDDLIAERDRLLKEKQEAEEQRDDQLKMAQTQLVPLLVNFTATTSALIPLLQQVVRTQEGHGGL